MMIRTRKKYKKNDIGVECRKCGRHEESTEHVPTTYCTYCSQSTVQDFSWLLYQFTVYYCCGFGLIIIFFVFPSFIGDMAKNLSYLTTLPNLSKRHIGKGGTKLCCYLRTQNFSTHALSNMHMHIWSLPSVPKQRALYIVYTWLRL